MLSLLRPDGKDLQAYVSFPKQASPHAIIVLQEWWGVNEQIMGVADRFADAGFLALAPDLYEGAVTADRDEARHLMDGLDFVDAVEQGVQGSLQWALQHCEQVSVMGYCMGGVLAGMAAVRLKPLTSVICCYGIPKPALADLGEIRIPIQGHFAVRDDWCRPEIVDEAAGILERTGARFEFFRYDAAHGFMNETRTDVFHAEHSNRAWARMLAFLREAAAQPTSE
jgi:carboxymethylenebutenolidase